MLHQAPFPFHPVPFVALRPPFVRGHVTANKGRVSLLFFRFSIKAHSARDPG